MGMIPTKRPSESRRGTPSWFVTFADLSCLVSCFFVLLLSFADFDARKYKRVSGSMKEVFGVQSETPVDGTGGQLVAPGFIATPRSMKLIQRLDEEIAEEIAKGLIEVEQASDGLVLRMKDAVVFKSGEAGLRPEFLPVLDRIGKIVDDVNAQVTVSGHTDNVPVREGGPVSSNWHLSVARGVSVVEHWERRFEIPADRLAVAGFGPGQPLATNSTPQGRAANRRVEFKIKLPESAVSIKGLRELLAEDVDNGRRPATE